MESLKPIGYRNYQLRVQMHVLWCGVQRSAFSLDPLATLLVRDIRLQSNLEWNSGMVG